MNKRFFLNTLVLLFSFSALAVKPNLPRNKVKRDPAATQTSQTTGAHDIILDDDIDGPTVGESWGKVIRLKWTSLSKNDAWNIGASIITCGIIAYIYHHAPKNSMPDNAINPSHNDQGPDNTNKNHIHKPKPNVCDLCFEDKKEHEFCTLSCCGHNASCSDCLAEMMNVSLKEKTTAQILCPNRDCLRAISEQNVRNITHSHPDIHKTYLDVSDQEWLAKNTKHCPTPDCSFAFMNDQEVQQSFKCPQCSHTYCSNCLKSHSTKMTCTQAEEDLKLTGNKTRAEQADNEWKRQNSKKCPQCRADIQKNEGCNHMTCKCRYQFCWVCLGPWNPKLCNCPMFPPIQNNMVNNHIHGNVQQGQPQHFQGNAHNWQ